MQIGLSKPSDEVSKTPKKDKIIVTLNPLEGGLGETRKCLLSARLLASSPSDMGCSRVQMMENVKRFVTTETIYCV